MVIEGWISISWDLIERKTSQDTDGVYQYTPIQGALPLDITYEDLTEQTPSNTLDNFSDTTETSTETGDSMDIELDNRGRR